jgi:LytR cell envelope-related transcriptional attenuator
VQHGRLAKQQARRQQRERLAGVLVVLVGLFVAAVAVVALGQPNGHHNTALSARSGRTAAPKRSASPHRPSPARRSSVPTTPGTGSGAPAQAVPLIVLNNTTTSGLAKQAAQRFQSGGWTVTRYDNYQNDIISTCAYYDPAVQGALAAAQALQQQYPTIKRVAPKFLGLPTGPVVVVLTPDYSAG